MTTHATRFGPLTPAEVAFLAENEPATIIPRQRLAALDLISGPIPALVPPHRAAVPLWLALLLKKQKRCNIVAPPWLSIANVRAVLEWEIAHPGEFAPQDRLPFRWLETSTMLLEAAGEDLGAAAGGAGGEEEELRGLLKELREVRQTKAREKLRALDGGFLSLDGLGYMELTEIRGFAKGVEDNLHRLTAIQEQNREEQRKASRDVDMDDASDTAGYGTDEDDTMAGGRSSTGYRGSSTAYTRGSSSVAARVDEDDY